jgi:hypothetical protein
MKTTKNRRAMYLLTATAAALNAGLSSQAIADQATGGPIPEGHAPAGVMVDHMHKAGEFMLGYRYSYGRQSGDTLNGTSTASEHDILHDACQNPKVDGHEHCMMKQKSMDMQMHMLDIMYAPTDWLTLMAMPQWMTMDMTMEPVEQAHMGGGMHMGAHSHGTDGIGDTIFGGIVKLSDGPGYHLQTGLMFSAPTGSTSEKGSTGALTHYMMQLGSGTWDFLPSLTYTGRMDRLSWGLQLSGVIRMEDENDEGYALGNVFQANGWAAYRLVDWLSASVRVQHTRQGEVSGSLDHTGMGKSPPDLPSNYGGEFWDVGFGINTVVTAGSLKGHRLSVEWLQPIEDDVNGFQQERDGTFYANWSKAF